VDELRCQPGRSGRPSRRPANGKVLCIVAAAALACLAATAPADDAEAAYVEGMRLLRSADPAGAADAFGRAVELQPKLGKAWLQLGIARSRAREWEAAIAAYRRLIELEPDNAKAPNNLANVYFRQGNHEEAARWYARALEIDPDYLLATFHYGWMLRSLNRADEARQWFERCVEIEPTGDRERKTRLDCLYYMGALRFRAREYAEAASIMERVLAMYPGHPEARYYLGMSYRQLGRPEDAERQLELHGRVIESIRSSQPIEKQPDP